MDLTQKTNPVVSDFSTQEYSTNFGTENAGSVYNVRYALSFSVDDTATVGQVVSVIPLDNAIEPQTVELANLHERYAINDLHMNIQSVAPFGTSSGAVQIAYIPDPTNLTFGSDTAENFSSIIRQSGSFCHRPRDSTDFPIKTEGVAYCKASGDPRFTSFGGIAIIVRDVPATGDLIRASFTLAATYQYYKTTFNGSTTLVNDQLALRILSADKDEIKFKLPDVYLPSDITVQLAQRVPFAVLAKRGGVERTFIERPNKLKLKRVSATTFVAKTAQHIGLRDATEINTSHLKMPIAARVSYFA